MSRVCLALFVVGLLMALSGFALAALVEPTGVTIVAFALLVLGGGLILDIADGMIG